MLKNKTRRKSHTNKNRRGVTTVEFAIVLPTFILLLFASFEFSRLNVIRHTADNAAYEAARIGMVPGATAAEAVAEANRILGIVSTRGATVTITPAVLDSNTDTITVAVDVPLSQNGWIVPRFSGGAVMHAESTLRAERAGQ